MTASSVPVSVSELNLVVDLFEIGFLFDRTEGTAVVKYCFLVVTHNDIRIESNRYDVGRNRKGGIRNLVLRSKCTYR